MKYTKKMYDRKAGNPNYNPCITSQVLHHWAIQANNHRLSSQNYHIPPLYYVFTLDFAKFMTEILTFKNFLLYCMYALTSLLFSVLLAGVDLPDTPQ